MRTINTLFFLCLIIFSTPSVLKAQYTSCQGDCACLRDVVVQQIKNNNFIEAFQIMRGSNACFEHEELYTPMILGAFKVASDSIKRANSIVLKAITFYQDRYGLAYDAQTKRYGFIDKNLTVKLPFQYEEAEPFANEGWGAIVKRNGTKFLIDTLGKEYEVATKLSELTLTTKALVLRNADFQALSPSIGMYKKLEMIFLYRLTNDSPLLKDIPDEVGELVNLRFLTIFNNPYIRLPKSLGNLQKLEKLAITACQLVTLPKELGRLKNLIYLDLSNNQLENLPLELGQLSQLQTLILDYNKILSLPKTVGNLKKLINMEMRSNALSEFPSECSQLVNLRNLNLYNNQLTSIPKGLSKLKKIEYLNLSVNNLNNIPKEIGELQTLKELSLMENKLSNIPKELGNLKNLEVLDLDRNILDSLPKELGQLTKLTKLTLYSNRLTSLPKELGNLNKLKILIVENNKISSLPIELFNLKALTSLCIGSNQIENLPNEVCNLLELEIISAAGNKITNIPNDIGNLKKLESFIISGNRITELPESLCNLPVIRDLFYITNNPLDIIPDCVQTLLNKLNGGYSPPPREVEMKVSRTDSAFEAARISFSEKKYLEAYKAAFLSAELDSSNYNKFFNLSFYALFVGEYKQAIEAAQKTLSLNPDAVHVETNLALGYLLDNQYGKAETIYKKWKGRKFTSNDAEMAETIFLQDLKDLENAGVLPENRANDIKRIRKLLKN